MEGQGGLYLCLSYIASLFLLGEPFLLSAGKYGICQSVIVIVMTEAAKRGGVGNWCLGRIILLLVLALLALSSDHTARAIGASIVGMRWE